MYNVLFVLEQIVQPATNSIMIIRVVPEQVFAVLHQTALVAGTRHAQCSVVELQMAFGMPKIIPTTHIHVKWVGSFFLLKLIQKCNMK